MSLEGKHFGFGICASLPHLEAAVGWIGELVARGGRVQPILTPATRRTSGPRGDGGAWRERLAEVTGNRPWTTIEEAEPVGPKKLFDAMVIAPCTGSTLARLALALTDTAVLMAAKSQLRNGRPVVVGVASNDLLGLNAWNLATLLNTRNVYFVPFGQDDPVGKPNGLCARWEKLVPTVEASLQGRQLQPMIDPIQ